ncbi:MAG TPA: ATP synthase F1 subunit epsilon [Candidatus Saccharimonadales bacterium]|jgi:F-type H+-transporting ATPase subunit epsilon|nr:ATP synthase F1 subunit epsilon [Candidatus Saccharimonadales bacterium]
MNFELVTLDGVKFKADAYSAILPTASGQITVLPGHEPLLTQLVPGIIIIRRNKSDADYHLEHYATYGGVAEIGKAGVRILVDEATHGDEINVAEAQKAHAEAARLLKDAKNQVELDRAQTMFARQAVRLEVAEIRRRHSRKG